MADTEEDAPENKGMSGVWNATLGREDAQGNSVLKLAAGNSLSNVFAGGDGEALNAVFWLSVIATGAVTLGLETYESFSWDSQRDAAIVALASPQSAQGYSAISGAETFILVKNNETWRIYKKSGDEGEYVLDPIAALEIVNRVTQSLAQASAMTNSPQTMAQGVALNLPRDVTFEHVSVPYGRPQGEGQYISRFFENQQTSLTAGESIAARYERLHSIWSAAQADIMTGRYGFTPQELSAIETPDRFMDGAFTKAKYTGGTLIGLWLLGSMGFGVGEAIQRTAPGQRRRQRKPQKPV